jgi:MoxR-like ATPase
MTVGIPPFGEPLSPEEIESRLRSLAEGATVDPGLDELEMRYLLEVLMRSSLLLGEGYDSRTLDRIFAGERQPSVLLETLDARAGGAREDQLLRAWSVPDVLRTYGDKCLYDVGLAGRTIFRGIDLSDLGPRSYGLASRVLALLADDRTLRDYYDRNLVERLPIEEEVLFLRQCAARFRVYAQILQAFRGWEPALPSLPPDQRSIGRLSIPEDSAASREVGLMSTIPGPGLPATQRPAEPRTVWDPHDDGEDLSSLDRSERLTRYERRILLSSLDLQGLRVRLKEAIIDQDDAVDRFCDDLAVFATGTRARPRPQSYLLAGPTGVGKNYLIETLVHLLEEEWETEIPFLFLEGPQYTYPSDVNELKGSTRGFVRSDEEGLLAEFYDKARLAPLSFLVVDEVEKAHPQLTRFFLALMDRGSTLDNRGRVLRFPATILTYTSNLGYSEASMRGPDIGYGGGAARSGRRAASRTLKRGLAPEFLNRLRVIHFAPLSRASAARILDLEVARIAARYQDRHGIELVVSSSARAALVDQGFSVEYGARHLVSEADRVLNVEVALRLQRGIGPMPEPVRRLVGRIRQARRGERPIDEAVLHSEIERQTRLRRGPRRIIVDTVDRANGKDGVDKEDGDDKAGGAFTYREEAP